MVFTNSLDSSNSPLDQLGPAYSQFSAEERVRHVELLQQVQRPGDVALDAQPVDADRWAVTICTSDAPGALATIAGLFTARRLDIQKADVFTVRLGSTRSTVAGVTARRRMPRSVVAAAPAQPARKVLDVFEIRALEPASPATWDSYREELSRLMGLIALGDQASAHEQVIEHVSEALRVDDDSERLLFPVIATLDNDASPEFTQLTIRSTDTPGFLFAFTNGLSALSVNIERAEIRTVNGETQDTFWIVDLAGDKVTSEERMREIRVAATLLKQFTQLLPRSPNPAQAMRQFNALTRQVLSQPDWAEDLQNLGSQDVLAMLADVMGVSRFLWEDFLRMQHENLFPALVDVGALDDRRAARDLHGALTAQLREASGFDDQVRVLNEFKDREMFRIDLRHITNRADFRAFSEELTSLGDVAMEGAIDLIQGMLDSQYGAPLLANGQRCPISICSLGKFGGREMGYGSDIEMIVVYEDEGRTDGPDGIEVSRYFWEFVRTLLTTVKAQREGIFEIDLRLRPHGKGGPLASTLDGFREYYSPDGPARQFERLALVKLRPSAGDTDLGARLVEARDAFVYSSVPLDFDDVLHLRQRQAGELVAPGTVSAKYSHGGLVDVEYFVQTTQIRAGHSNPSVRVANTLEAIERLEVAGQLPSGHADRMTAAYSFFRRVIDALRVVRGHAKDLTIPPVDSREFAYLARRLRYEADEELQEAIATHMDFAGGLWEENG